ncbi:general transcriptional corepressor trfA isoform X1 [Musca domestica]|uniref:Mediator of DNA damage checkpoint protein 1 n=2 Tax=Musca domestica TaxID=7370 RepID=A0A1I8MPS5_MUSDO|nr:general transcriptional corepressor trfA isoform X1 [Musca domestica]
MNENLSIMSLEINGQRHMLEVGQLYLFGKLLPPNDTKFVFNIENEDVDEKHCCVGVFAQEDVYVYDLFSSQGTYLNGKRLRPFTKVSVKTGDEVRLGRFQCLRFHNDEQMENSHDSSGFGDNNKNTSDIIASSPETTTHRDSRVKRLNNNSSDNFLMPAIPSSSSKAQAAKSQSSRLSNSFVVPETEAALSNSRRSSIGFNTSNRGRSSDSFMIPETQYCGGRASLASNLSIAESTTSEGDKTRLDNSTGDDDFCIPETQEVLSSQRPRPYMDKMKPLEEKSVDLNDSDDEGINGSFGAANGSSGSQFRISTQDYNEGFGEEDNSLMQSQVIPLIRHNTVLLNSSVAPARQEPSPNKEPTEDDNEVANINSFAAQNPPPNPQVNDDLNCSTPDLFDCQALEAIANENNAVVTDLADAAVNLFENDPPPAGLDDEEDYLATQMFPASNTSSNNTNSGLDKNKTSKDKNIFESKEDEPFLTLSDKENMHPDKLDPVSDLPPTQLFASNDAMSEHSSTSTSSSRKSNATKSEEKHKRVPTSNTSQKQIEEDLLAEPTVNVMGDEEDDILTQAFVPPPPKSTSSRASSVKSVNHCFNSTLLEDKAVAKNPASFFAEMETSPKGLDKTIATSNVFKMPEKNFSTIKKTSSAASTTSTESDMDLLMCTPQLIKDHIPFSKADDLRKNMLAVKNKNLFGDDDDDDEDDKSEDCENDKCLVQLINVPKNTNDFDKLLPHLKQEASNGIKNEPKITKEQKAAIEARKEYKFNTSFGEEPNAKKDRKSTSSSSTLSRDQRHAARDREKQDRRKTVNEVKTKESSSRQKKKEPLPAEFSKEDKSKEIKEKVEENETSSSSSKTIKRGRPKKNDEKKEKKASSKRLTRSVQDKDSGKDEDEITTVKQAKQRQQKEKESEETEKVRPPRRNTRQQSSEKPPPKETKDPPKRNTRLKSRETQSSKDSITTTDDMDLMSTQTFVHNTRTRTRSRSQQSEERNDATKKASNSSTSSSTLPNSLNSSATTLNRSSSRLNSSITNSIEKKIPTSASAAVRKRKSETPAPQQIEEKKRLKRINSHDSTTSTASSSASGLSARPLISITMVEPERFNELQTKSRGLWAVAKDPKDSEVLVMDKTFRTFKFLLAMARGIPIVTSQWLEDINSAKSLKKVPPLSNYILNDPGFEKKHKFSLASSLQLAKENKKGLFYGYEFVMTTNIKPVPTELQAIIEIAGGIVHAKGTPAPKDNQKLYLISCNDDRKDWHKVRRINKNITIITTEAIMSSIMRQNCTPLSNHVLV